MTGLINTRPATSLPTDRIDLMEDLNVAVAQQAVLDTATDSVKASRHLSPGDVSIKRVGSSSIARASLVWTGGTAEGEELLKAVVAAATSYVLGDDLRSQFADQLEIARADAVSADGIVTTALVNNGGVDPQSQVNRMQAQVTAGTWTRGSAAIARILKRAAAFDRLQRNALLANQALDAANQRDAQDEVTSRRTTTSLMVQIEATQAAPATADFRRVLAGGLLAGLAALVVLVVTVARGDARRKTSRAE